ncbi:MAG: plastocyanin/azurin family copper-binding protein [Natronosporangium sp.]
MEVSRDRRRRGVRRMAAVTAAAALAGVFGVAAPAAASSSPGALSDPGTLQDHEVIIDAFAFDPQDIVITAGESIQWTNQQAGAVHTVTHDDSGAGSPILETGDTWEVLFTLPFDEPLTYHCEIHPFMTGSVTVNPAG